MLLPGRDCMEVASGMGRSPGEERGVVTRTFIMAAGGAGHRMGDDESEQHRP